MFIVPISSNIVPLQPLFGDDKNASGSAEGSSPAFSDVFEEVLNETKDAAQVVKEDNLKIMMGEIDDLHTIYNNMTKYEIAVETFVAVTNAAADSYNRIMQINL